MNKLVEYLSQIENKTLLESCLKGDLITQTGKDILSNYAETIRNKYLHGNLHQIIEKITIPAFKVDLQNLNTKPEPTYVTQDNLPTIRAIAKNDIDKVRSRKMIIQTAKMLNEISNRTYSSEVTKDA